MAIIDFMTRFFTSLWLEDGVLNFVSETLNVEQRIADFSLDS